MCHIKWSRSLTGKSPPSPLIGAHHFTDASAGRAYVAPEVCANRPIRSSTQRVGYSPKLRSERVSFLSATMAVAVTLLLLVAHCECGIMCLMNDYPPDWDEIATRIKDRACRKCVRCGHAHNVETGHVLTVHHLDGDKANCEDWNLAALCQRCHLHVQAKVDMDQEFMFGHSEWMQPFVEGRRRALAQDVNVAFIQKRHSQKENQMSRLGDEPRKCSKCGCENLGLKHHPAGACMMVRCEHMHHFCRGCGYHWTTLPLDHAPAAQEDGTTNDETQ